MEHLNFFLSCLITLLALQLIPTTLSAPNLVPSDLSKLQSQEAENIKAFNKNNAGKDVPVALDAVLAEAQQNMKVITVAKSGSADFHTITAAVNSIPDGNQQRIIIWIGGGVYTEQVFVKHTKPYVTFYGHPKNRPQIVFNGTAKKYGTANSATVNVISDYFMAVNIDFVNSAPKPGIGKQGDQAVAMRIWGDKAAFHNCKFIGYQDTLYDDRGRHFFKDCYIRGSIDFIFGNGKSLYLNTVIESVADSVGWITAQERQSANEDSGFTFLHCKIIGNGANNTYLGRAWMQRPRVVFAYTYMGNVINSAGWSPGKHPEAEKNFYYGEYKCMGPGSSTSGRVGFSKKLTDEEVKPYLSMTYIQGDTWLTPPPNLPKP